MEYFPECSGFYIRQLVIVQCDNHFYQGSRGDTRNYHLPKSLSHFTEAVTIYNKALELRKYKDIYITYFIIYVLHTHTCISCTKANMASLRKLIWNNMRKMRTSSFIIYLDFQIFFLILC